MKMDKKWWKNELFAGLATWAFLIFGIGITEPLTAIWCTFLLVVWFVSGLFVNKT